jgi:replication factor C large subunit
MVDWTEKYRPATLSEIRGNDKARDTLKSWAETWDDHGEAAVLHGSPGVGKTSAAHALANDMGWKTVELNASDQRTADVIERLAGRAAQNATLGGSAAGTGGRQLVIVDEADNLHGTYDRGGARALTDLVKKSSQPVGRWRAVNPAGSPGSLPARRCRVRGRGARTDRRERRRRPPLRDP